VSRYCDQYNLAITYQEMLTGQLPFTGKTGRQLMLQHLTELPNLTPLPSADQPVVARGAGEKAGRALCQLRGVCSSSRAEHRCRRSWMEIETGASPSSLDALPAGLRFARRRRRRSNRRRRSSRAKVRGVATLGGDPRARTIPRARGGEHARRGRRSYRRILSESIPIFATVGPKPALDQPSRRPIEDVPPPPERPETTGDGIFVPRPGGRPGRARPAGFAGIPHHAAQTWPVRQHVGRYLAPHPPAQHRFGFMGI